ncbi:DUF5687 family protein [Flavilitoribacter nigricans]|nr:DUF5687 family protein [Flavilitoribacter nigricans]
MFRKLLSLDILSRIRSPFWQKSIGINVVLILLALYLMLNFLALGFFLDKFLMHFYPDADPIQVFNRFFLYYLVYDLIMRFFMQNMPVTSVKSFMLLPIRRSRLVYYLLAKSFPNFFNLLPFLFLVPFMFKAVIPSLGLAAWAWLALCGLLVFINHCLAILLKRSFMIRPLAAIGLVVGILTIAWFDFQGVLPFSESFGRWMDWTARNTWGLLLPLSVFVTLVYLLYRLFYSNIYLDKLIRSDKEEASNSGSLDWLGRFGKIGRLIQLDLQLIRRNKRPRVMATMSIFFLLYPLIVLQDGLENKMGIAIFVSVFTTGLFMINYGQFMLAWESSFFDYLRVRQISIKEYFESKFYLFGLSTTIVLILSMLYAFVYPILPLFFVAGALFNMGVSTFILMFTSTYNVRKIDLGKGAFMNWEGVGASQFLLILPIMVLPMLIYWLFSLWAGMYGGLAAISILGIIGILLKDPILDALARQFERRKYIMTSSFKKD